MPFTLPPSVDSYLAKRPVVWALVTKLLDRLASLEGMNIGARMAAGPTLEISYPEFSFEFHDGRILAFRMSLKVDIEICFITMADRTQFELLFGGGEIVPSDGPPEPERLNDLRLDKEVIIQCDGVDTQALTDALIEVTLTTPMRRLIPSAADTHLVELIKQLYASRDAYHYEAFSEALATAMTESNLDDIMDLLTTFSPWANEDPRNVAETKLMLLFEVIAEQEKLLMGAVTHLLRLRPEFVAFGVDALEDVQEVDDLLQRLKGTTH